MDKEKNKEREFEGIEIPETITDPEERELVELINRVTTLAVKKEWSIMLIACSGEREHKVSIVEGCAHCMAMILKNSLDRSSELLQMLMMAIATHMKGKSSEEGRIVTLARKNTPEGN